MQETTAFPWGALGYLLLATAGVFGAVLAVVRITDWVETARDELRDRYADDRWQPAAIDLIACPLWLALELLCLAGAIVFALLTIWLAYETAKGVRNWWHAGERDHRGR